MKEESFTQSIIGYVGGNQSLKDLIDLDYEPGTYYGPIATVDFCDKLYIKRGPKDSWNKKKGQWPPKKIKIMVTVEEL